MKLPSLLRCGGLLLACLLAGPTPLARADSTVVINEIHYHPAGSETNLEWIELFNQMGVDMDLSNWSLDKGIQYRFPEGTIIPGGAYRVVALDPAFLASQGVTGVLGPFTGRLANGGDTIELRNNNLRLMDSVTYGVEGDWPVGADGAGPSLAKVDPDLAGDRAGNWAMSEQSGGTPGAQNFPPRVTTVTTTNLILLNSSWRYDASGNDLGTAWRSPGFDDSLWGAGAGLFYAGTTAPSQIEPIPTLFNSGVNSSGVALAAGAADPHYVLTTSAYSTPPPPFIAATAAANHPNWLANDATSLWIGPTSAGANNVPPGNYYFRTTFDLTGFDVATASISLQTAVDNELNNVLLNGVSIGLRYTNFTSFSPTFIVNSGFVPGTNTLDFQTVNISASANPAGFRARASGTAARFLATNTALPLGPSTFYFRKSFVFNGNPALTGIRLRTLADDGAVFYLNGVEIFRQNMPAGAPNHGTLAVTNVGVAAVTGPFSLGGAGLVFGTNVLAVEVHQAAGGGSDALFGTELVLVTTNLPPSLRPTLAFNELSSVSNGQFTVEILNQGPVPVTLTSNVLVRFGNTNTGEYVIPAQTLLPGQFLVLDKSMMGFGADPGDRVVLYAPGRTSVLDAVIAKSFPRGRWPDGTGDWYRPSGFTPGTSNVFQFNRDIVLNEILYSHRELPPMPEVRFTNALVSMTNDWRYNQSGQDLGTGWREPGYDDSQWAGGRALFWTGLTAGVLTPLRGTQVSLSNGPQPIITYYFRTRFVVTNNPLTTLLVLNHYVDDGAVFYLNGTEVYRYGISADPVYSTNLANFNIGNATNTGPVILPTTNFVVGTNILAVEVHQVLPPPGSRDLVFGAELAVTGILSPATPAQESPEAWVELYNRGTGAVALAGWKLDNDISYSFPTGTVLAAGGYLVVAKDAGLLNALHPGLNALGNFSGKLSKSGARVVLRDAFDNPVNSVRYFDGRPWPPFADGQGSSLELRDPWADNSRPEAWADSDEGRNAVWITNVYTGVAAVEPASSPTQWREFVFGLLGEGDVLIDNLSVIENPLTTRRQLLQNGNFENGLATWRFLGNHRRAEVIAEPGNPANLVLHLVTTGDTEHMHNHAETTLTNNLAITNGVSYEISFRAKWLAGCNKLNTRLYFNRLARTTELPVPFRNGTPGARNSRYATNIGPTYLNLAHAPVVPLSGDAVTISADAYDADGVTAATLYYSVNGGAWQSSALSFAPAPSVHLEGLLPPRAQATVVQFYIEAVDGLGARSTFPAGGTNSRALYAVGGQALNPRLKKLRFIMPPADVAYMHASTNVMSNERYGCTVIADESRIFYDAALHLQGSQRGRDNSTRVGLSVALPADNLYRGVHDGFTVDRSGGYSGKGGDHDEILLKHCVNKAGGLPGMYDDLAQIFAPRSTDDGTGLLIMAKYGKVFLDSQYEDGANGELHKLELIYYPTPTSSGDVQAPKLPQPDNVLGTDIKGLGDDAENYRWTFLKENHSARNNYAPMVALARAFDLTGPVLDAQMRLLMDVDEWMRAVAFINLLGGGDIYSMGNSHNLMIYFRPGDGRAMAFLWDMDFSFVNATTQAFPGTGSPNTTKLITTIPANYRAFLSHLYDLTAVTGNAAYLADWNTRYAGMVGENWSAAVDFLVQRAAYVRGQLPTATPFAISNNGGNNFAVATAQVVLTGTAPITVNQILLNGVAYPINWISTTTWSILVPLTGYTNLLTVRALDRAGTLLTNLVDSITVTNTGTLAPVPVVINEWMAANAGPGGLPDPLDGAFQDWIELYNPNFVDVNLAGYYLSDDPAQPGKWQFPSNSVIGARGYLLLWADNQATQNVSGAEYHTSFQLNGGGEYIGLYSTNLTPQHLVQFGAQAQNVSQGYYPDGNTNNLQSMPNWTPRAANILGAPPNPVLTNLALLPDGTLSFTVPLLPNRAYRVDYKDDLNAPNWTPFLTNRTSNATLTVSDSVTNRPQRFYQVVLLP